MATIAGTPSDDLRRGTRTADDIAGRGGNDTLLGLLGNDQLDGGEGNDSLEGGPDNDVLFGGPGNDTLRDGTHNDTLYGGQDNDRLYSTQGYDVLDAGSGDDSLYGGSDYVTMSGGDGRDVLFASLGGSNLNGGPGDDTMTGGIGSDAFKSEENDADTFIIRADEGNFGSDQITGFNGGGKAGGDVLRLVGFEPGNVKVTEHFGFPGYVFFDRTVAGDNGAATTKTNAPEKTIAATTEETVTRLSGIFGSPTEQYTRIETDQGTIQIDEVGLIAGTDYIFV
jgi:Ca2+-binding RTX toxin-like protein